MKANELVYINGIAYCAYCGKRLEPHKPRWSAESTFIGYYSCNCRRKQFHPAFLPDGTFIGTD